QMRSVLCSSSKPSSAARTTLSNFLFMLPDVSNSRMRSSGSTSKLKLTSGCATPSSSTRKSSFVRPGTTWPLVSTASTSTRTRDTPERKITSSWATRDAADTRREVLGEECAHAAEHAGGKEAQREAEEQHRGVAERNHRISHYDHARTQREHNEAEAPPDPIGKIAACEIARDRT